MKMAVLLVCGAGDEEEEEEEEDEYDEHLKEDDELTINFEKKHKSM